MTTKKKTQKEPVPVSAEPVQAMEQTAGSACLSVVIPYCKEFAQGNELLFALRSWYKYAKFPFRIVIIGDREDWMDTENLTFIECPRISDIPSVDTLHKLWVALNHPDVSERFIWSNDDIYLVNPVSLAHIELPKVLGKLNPASYNGHYRAAMERTINELTELGRPILNYGTHTPVIFEKKNFSGLLPEDLEQAKAGLLFTSVYFNLLNEVHPVRLDWRTDPFLLPVVSKSPDEKLVNELLRNKVFMNNARSGYSPWLESFLSRRFPDKCPCEL